MKLRNKIKNKQILKVKSFVCKQFENRQTGIIDFPWMQISNWRARVGLCALIILLALTVMQSTAEMPRDTTTQVIEEAVVIKDTAKVSVEKIEENDDTIQQKLTATVEENLIEQNESHIDPLQLSGYRAPCDGLVQYRYGVSYDATYEDYRYHTDMCYVANMGDVYACVSGKIVSVQMDQTWQVKLLCTEGAVQYRGLKEVLVSEGDYVTTGQRIGYATKNIWVEVIL